MPVIITKNMETGNEKQNVNIAEILRYAPKGLKLYSPIFGEVEFDFLDDNNDIHISFKEAFDTEYFDLNGKYFKSYSNAECLLFPSINHRCWNHWQNTLFLESIGSVCVDTITGNKFILDHNGTFFGDGTGSQYSTLIDGEDASNYLLNSRYASQDEAKEFFKELEKNGYEWNGKTVVKKEVVPHKFKVGDIVKFDRPFAALKREILSIDFENERYLTRRTDIGGAIKEFIYFCEQDDYVIVGSHCTPSLEDKVNILADEILALKERVKALEIQVIKDMSTPPLTKDPYFKSNKITCDLAEGKDKTGIQVYATPDKAGDNVTLEEMKS